MALAGVTSSLADKRWVYPDQEGTRVVKITRDATAGFGFEVEGDAPGLITEVDLGGPADVAGLREGDRVVNIGGGEQCGAFLAHAAMIKMMKAKASDSAGVLHLVVLGACTPPVMEPLAHGYLDEVEVDCYGFEAESNVDVNSDVEAAEGSEPAVRPDNYYGRKKGEEEALDAIDPSHVGGSEANEVAGRTRVILAEAGAGPVTYMSVKRLLVAELGAEVCARQSIVVKSTIHKHLQQKAHEKVKQDLFREKLKGGPNSPGTVTGTAGSATASEDVDSRISCPNDPHKSCSAAHRKSWYEFLSSENSREENLTGSEAGCLLWHIPAQDGSGRFSQPEADPALRVQRGQGSLLVSGGRRLDIEDWMSESGHPRQVRGVPHELRRQVWLKSSGAADCKASSTSLEYYEIVICAEKLLHDSETMLQIDKDLLRTYPTNIMFDQMSSEGTCRLRRILLATGWCEPEIGYCQGINMIAATLLLIMEEDEAFWTLRAMIRLRLPLDYYSKSLSGVMADQHVFGELLETNEPHVSAALSGAGIDISLVTLHCIDKRPCTQMPLYETGEASTYRKFLTIFANVSPIETTFRIWDVFMLEGSVVLFKVAIAMVTLRSKVICSEEEPGNVFNLLGSTPMTMGDPDVLMNLSFSFEHIEPFIFELRKRYIAEVEATRIETARRRAEVYDERTGAGPGDEDDEEEQLAPQMRSPTGFASVFKRMNKAVRAVQSYRVRIGSTSKEQTKD